MGFEPDEISKIPRSLTGISGKLMHQTNSYRTAIDFHEDFLSIAIHAEKMEDEARFSQVVNQIYIPKMKAKFHAPYFYHNEQMRYLSDVNESKFDPKRDPD